MKLTFTAFIQLAGVGIAAAAAYSQTLPQPVQWTPTTIGIALVVGLGAAGLLHLPSPLAPTHTTVTTTTVVPAQGVDAVVSPVVMPDPKAPTAQ